MTKNLIRFAITFALFTLTFRYVLSYLLEEKMFTLVWATAAFFMILFFGTGWFYGKKDHKELPIYDIGFRFHLATYVIFNTISEFWFLLGLQSSYESIKMVHYTAIFWGIGLLAHLIFYLMTRKNTINGLNKNEIFE